MSPEQLEGRPVDGRADQYALACAAFELLTGRPPFRRDQGLAAVFAHLSAPPPPVRSQRPGLPAQVDDVFARALAKAASGRFATCGDFAESLRAALGLALYDAGSAGGSRGEQRLPQPGPAPGYPGVRPATVDAGRATVLPQRSPAPSAPWPPEPARGYPAAEAAAGDAGAQKPDRARGRRPARRTGVIAATGALAAAAIIAIIIGRGSA